MSTHSKPNAPADVTTLREPSEGVPQLSDTWGSLRKVRRLLEASTGSPAIDTERAGGHRYGNATYLVQVRKDDVGTFLIDTGALPDLSSLKPALSGTWLLHAAPQDLLGLSELGLYPDAVFDTEIASRLLGHRRFSLGALTEDVLGKRLLKSHQNEDWSLRPLPKDWLRYAALDVELLPQLASHLTDELAALGRADFAAQEFQNLLDNPLVPREQSWRDTKGLGAVRTRRGLAVAKTLWEARDALGKELDIAPGRLLSAQAITEASVALPKSRTELRRLRGFQRPPARKHFQLWDEALRDARALPDSELPPLRTPVDPNVPPPARAWKRANPQAWSRLQYVRQVAAEAASDLGLEPEVVLEPKVQREVAWWPAADPKMVLPARMRAGGARPWQVDVVMTRVLSDPAAAKRSLDN